MKIVLQHAAQRPGEAEHVDVLHQVDAGAILVEHRVEEPRELHDRIGAHVGPRDEAGQGLADLVTGPAGIIYCVNRCQRK